MDKLYRGILCSAVTGSLGVLKFSGTKIFLDFIEKMTIVKIGGFVVLRRCIAFFYSVSPAKSFAL